MSPAAAPGLRHGGGELGHRAAPAQHLHLDLHRAAGHLAGEHRGDRAQRLGRDRPSTRAIARAAMAATIPPCGTTTSIQGSDTDVVKRPARRVGVSSRSSHPLAHRANLATRRPQARRDFRTGAAGRRR